MAKKKKEVLTHLDSIDLNRIEKSCVEESVRRERENWMSLAIALASKDIELAKSKLDLATYKQAELRRKHIAERADHKAFIAKLLEKYDVTQLGYDPLTGEINKD